MSEWYVDHFCILDWSTPWTAHTPYLTCIIWTYNPLQSAEQDFWYCSALHKTDGDPVPAIYTITMLCKLAPDSSISTTYRILLYLYIHILIYHNIYTYIYVYVNIIPISSPSHPWCYILVTLYDLTWNHLHLLQWPEEMQLLQGLVSQLHQRHRGINELSRTLVDVPENKEIHPAFKQVRVGYLKIYISGFC